MSTDLNENHIGWFEAVSLQKYFIFRLGIHVNLYSHYHRKNHLVKTGPYPVIRVYCVYPVGKMAEKAV